MNVNTIRSFATGLFLSTSICGVVYFMQPDEAVSTEKNEEAAVKELSSEEMKNKLAAEGFIIHSKEEWQEQKEAIEKEAATKVKEEAKANDEKKKDEKEPKKEQADVAYRTVITVSMGMTSIDVGRALEKANIIKKPMDFVNAVEKQGLATRLKPGSYEVDSNMSMQDVINVMFKKN